MLTIDDYIQLCLSAYGFAEISRSVVRGTRLERKPFTCPLCMGFWASGVFLMFRHFFGAAAFQVTTIPFSVAAFCYFISSRTKES